MITSRKVFFVACLINIIVQIAFIAYCILSNNVSENKIIIALLFIVAPTMLYYLSNLKRRD